MAELQAKTALRRNEPCVETIGQLRIRDNPDLSIAWLARRRGGDLAAAEGFLGLELPAPGDVASAGDHRAVVNARDQWLVLAPWAPDFADRLKAAGGAGVSVCDQSDGWVVFEIAGDTVEPLLARLCDLDPAMVTPMRASPSSIEHLRVIVMRLHTIPVMIVEAPETTAQAAAFVGQNSDRIAVSPLHLFQASLAAEDEDALTIDKVCQRAGVKILKSPRGTSKYGAGETTAIVTIERLVRKHTAPTARRILEVLAQADLAPITGHHIRAAEFLMCDKDHRTRFEPEELSKAIGELFLSAEDEAKALSHAHRCPFWKGLAVVWFRKTKKKRMHLRIAA